MPDKLERCVERVMVQGKEKDAAYAICQASIDKAIVDVMFADKCVYDAETHTVISCRDGVQEYLGSELGIEPVDKVFKIYRAPETIQAISDEMTGLFVTENHVPLDADPVNIIGKVVDCEVVQTPVEGSATTISLKNRINLDKVIDSKELSLGYFASLIPCELYDFEQVEIVPHHLAVVPKGRCGNLCTFTDGEKAMKKVHKSFLDASDEVNMAQVMEIVANLPEAIKTMPIKELAKLVPILQKVTMQAVESVQEGEILSPEEAAAKAAEAEKVATDEAAAAATAAETEKTKMADKKFADALAGGIADAVKVETGKFAVVLAKAKDFLPDTYDFTDKCYVDIMRDAVATVHADKFTDSELSTAFKMLKKSGQYKEFADKAADDVDAIGEKEL